MAGATFPGAPIILLGAGPNLGWGSTVNKPDLIDVYELTINPENDNQYWLDGAWYDLKVRDAAIDVTFFGPIRWTFHEPLYASVHGPVLKTKTGAFAIRWAGMDEMRTLEEMIALNKAQDQNQFEAALAMEAMPSINYVYADKAGNVAHYYNAMFPKRREGADEAGVDWRGLVPGDRSDLIWHDYLGFAAMPRTVNPEAGFVYNANNTPYEASVGAGQPVAADFPASMGIETGMTNRALRIRALFGADTSISRDDLHRYKYDNSYDPASIAAKATQAVLALEFEPGSDLAAGQEILRRWDRSTHADSHEAALAVLTAAPFVVADMRGEPAPDLRQTYADAVAHLQKHFDRLDPEWGTVNRLMRGDKSWPMSGAPDVLRAVYGEIQDDTGLVKDVAGDCYIMFAEWAADGTLSARSIHNFGSATLDATSPHFDDQAPLFAAEQERVLPLDMALLEAQKTADRRIGGGGGRSGN